MILHIPHYSWGIEKNLIDDSNKAMWLNYAKITGSMCLRADSTQDEVMYCVDICKSTGAVIGLNYSPYRWYYNKPEAPAMPYSAEAMTEIVKYIEFLQRMKGWINGTVRIGAVMLDSEAIKGGDNLTMALDWFTVITKEQLPEAKTFWYAHARHTWDESLFDLWTGREITSAICPEFYSVQEPQAYLRCYERNVELADSMGVKDIVPYLALSAGYVIGIAGWKTTAYTDTEYSRLMGMMISKLFPRVSAVVFYPSPFSVNYPEWPKHFEAYVQGATA